MPILALLPLLSSLAPEVIRWIAGDRAGAVAQTVADAVRGVAGGDDPAALEAAVADPAKAAELRLALARIAADAEAEARRAELAELAARLADIAGARQQTVALAQAGSALAWWGCVVDVLVLAGFLGAVAAMFAGALPEGGAVRDLALGAIGTLATLAVTIVSYWRGSSAGSARKDDRLQAMAGRPQ